MKHFIENSQRLVIFGPAPGPSWGPLSRPLEGRVMKRLCSLMKISEATYRTSTIRFNLLNSYPGKAGKGDKFPLSKAKSRARAFLPLLKGRTVLLLGVNTSKAFGLKLPLMTWTQAKGMTVAVLPHPSGICRWWNEEKNRQAASAFLIQALAGR